jgi:hypothetical protein
MRSHLTSCGIPGVGAVPYGIHMCHFYPSRQELLDGLIPYYQAGLQSKERCLWIASAPLPAVEIRTEVAKLSEMASALETGQLQILDAIEWHGGPGSSSAEGMIQRWIQEEERALASGFEGLRITGNTSFVPRHHWDRLMEYERLLHGSLHGRRIIACCSYARQDCRPVDVLEVVHHHDAALNRSEGRWDVYTRTSDLDRGQKFAGKAQKQTTHQ